jgi:hypothetical protein
VGSITGSKWPETELSSETRQSILVVRNCQETEHLVYTAVCYSLHTTAQTCPDQNRKRSRRPRCTTEKEDRYIKSV